MSKKYIVSMSPREVYNDLTREYNKVPEFALAYSNDTGKSIVHTKPLEDITNSKAYNLLVCRSYIEAKAYADFINKTLGYNYMPKPL